MKHFTFESCFLNFIVNVEKTWKSISTLSFTKASQTPSDTTTSAGDENTDEKPTKKSKKGKRVQWPADDANLATFHYFEMDEDERG